MTKRKQRNVKLSDESLARGRALRASAANALREIETMVSEQLNGTEGAPADAAGFAIYVFDNDKQVFLAGDECGVYDDTAGVCRDCTQAEFVAAVDLRESEFSGP